MQGGQRWQIFLERGWAIRQGRARMLLLDLAYEGAWPATGRCQLHALGGQPDQQPNRCRHYTGGLLDKKVGSGQVKAGVPASGPSTQVAAFRMARVGHYLAEVGVARRSADVFWRAHALACYDARPLPA